MARDVVGRVDDKLVGARSVHMVSGRLASTWRALARCLDCLKSSWGRAQRPVAFWSWVSLSKAMQFVSSDVERQ